MGLGIAIALLIPAIIIGVVWHGFYQEKQRKLYLQRCWNAYQYALQHMHVDPMSRANVVNYGRAYYAAMRGGALSIYDEMAISNDVKQAGG